MTHPIGNCPKEPASISKFRKHQGWWRVFVLNEPEGEYWDHKNQKMKPVCNRISDGKENLKNFLSDEIALSAKNAIDAQKKGMIDQERLYNNLLSSQPLAFNFFGWFIYHKKTALDFLKTIDPGITGLLDVVFEYAPDASKDNSAFDFGFIVEAGNQKGFIGFECKYTDSFSYQRSESKIFYGDDQDKNFHSYHEIYKQNRNRFPDDYFTYVRNKDFNQLFRNEMLGCFVKKEFDFIKTGLFCNHADEKAVSAGKEFQGKIGNRKNDFIMLTYADYITRMQKLDLSWEERELVMMLWVRYCGTQLSKEFN